MFMIRWRKVAAYDPTIHVVIRPVESSALWRLRVGTFAELVDAPDELEISRRIESRYHNGLVRCSRCKEYKPPSKFGKDKKTGGVEQRYCKACRAEWIAARRLSKWKRQPSTVR